jgi:hypothetical protein
LSQPERQQLQYLSQHQRIQRLTLRRLLRCLYRQRRQQTEQPWLSRHWLRLCLR